MQQDPRYRKWTGLRSTLDDGRKLKKCFYSFRDFRENLECRIIGLRMYYEPTKFNENRSSHFRENQNINIFLMWTTLNFSHRGKLKTSWDIYKRTLNVEFDRDRSISLGSTIGDRVSHTRTCTDGRTRAKTHTHTHTRAGTDGQRRTDRRTDRDGRTDTHTHTHTFCKTHFRLW